MYNSASNSLELLTAALDGTVQQVRFTGGDWTTPTSLGISTRARPALTATAAGVAAAVVGTSGEVSVSQFQAAAATTVSFSKDILRIFTNNGGKTCAKSGCHAGSRPQQGLDLEASQAYTNIVSVPANESSDLNLVEPGDADNSYLYMKVTGASGISGRRMPQTGGTLPSADLDLLRQWINAGAPNN
jgi:hypothetical protein